MQQRLQPTRLAERDVRAVHADTRILLQAGVIVQAADGKVAFPYRAIHADFKLQVT